MNICNFQEESWKAKKEERRVKKEEASGKRFQAFIICFIQASLDSIILDVQSASQGG